MDIKKLLSSEISDKLSSKLGIEPEKASGIIETISNVINKNGIDDIESSETEIQSELSAKNGLTSDLASKVKDLVLPIIMDSVKNKMKEKLGGVAGNLMGKLKF